MPVDSLSSVASAVVGLSQGVASALRYELFWRMRSSGSLVQFDDVGPFQGIASVLRYVLVWCEGVCDLMLVGLLVGELSIRREDIGVGFAGKRVATITGKDVSIETCVDLVGFGGRKVGVFDDQDLG